MKKNLIAIAAALLFGGGMSTTALAQDGGYYDRDGGYHAYGNDGGRDDRYTDNRYGDNRYGDDRYGEDRYGDNGYGDDDRRDDDRNRDDRYGDNQGGRSDRYDRGGGYDPYYDRNRDGRDDRNGSWDNRQHMARHRYNGGRYVEPRHYRYSRYNIGSRLPSGYYGNNYYVDYRSYGLRAPPRGYRWNRLGNDVYLVSINNGLVRDVFYSLFY